MPSIIDIEKVIQNEDVPNYIKRLAIYIIKYKYQACGDFFVALSDEELNHLTGMVDSIDIKDPDTFLLTQGDSFENLQYVTLLCWLLATGEGEAYIDKEQIIKYHQTLTSLLTVEVAYRQGKVMAFRKNYSMLDTDNIIAMFKKRKP